MNATDKKKLTKMLEDADATGRTVMMSEVASTGIKIDEEASKLIVEHQQRNVKDNPPTEA